MSLERSEDQSLDILGHDQIESEDDIIESIVLSDDNTAELTSEEILKINWTIAELESRTAINTAMLDKSEHDAEKNSKQNGVSPINSIEIYRHEVGKYDVLSSDEEITLTRAYKRAVTELKSICKQQQLTPEKEDCSDEIQIPIDTEVAVIQPTKQFEDLTPDEKGRADLLQGIADKTKEKLIQHNLRLAFSIAKHYQFRNLPLNDLLQEANIGLQKGVEKYDPQLGYRLSTYATFWIRQNITRELANKASLIRLPVHQHDLVRRVSATENRLGASLEREPTEEELASELDIEKTKLSKAIASRKVTAVTSINTPINSDPNSGELGDFILDDRVNIEGEIENIMRDSDVRSLLDSLHEREREVLELRFGIGTGKTCTFQEIADKYKISRERVRQIEVNALKKLRPVARKRNLQDYLE